MMEAIRWSKIILPTILLLLVPLIAMQFTTAVNWNGLDFLVAGILLFGLGLSLDLILQKVPSKRLRLSLGIAALLLFLLVWAELAVGVIG